MKQDLVQVKTIRQAIELKTPSIGSVTRTYGISKSMAYLKLCIIDLSQSINLKRPLTETQIDETALFITTEFNNITIADAYLVFKNAKMGKYGSFYESLDCPKVLSWFTEYMNEKIDLHEQISYSNHVDKTSDKRVEKAGNWMNQLEAKHTLSKKK